MSNRNRNIRFDLADRSCTRSLVLSLDIFSYSPFVSSANSSLLEQLDLSCSFVPTHSVLWLLKAIQNLGSKRVPPCQHIVQPFFGAHFPIPVVKPRRASRIHPRLWSLLSYLTKDVDEYGTRDMTVPYSLPFTTAYCRRGNCKELEIAVGSY